MHLDGRLDSLDSFTGSFFILIKADAACSHRAHFNVLLVHSTQQQQQPRGGILSGDKVLPHKATRCSAGRCAWIFKWRNTLCVLITTRAAASLARWCLISACRLAECMQFNKYRAREPQNLILETRETAERREIWNAAGALTSTLLPTWSAYLLPPSFLQYSRRKIEFALQIW